MLRFEDITDEIDNIFREVKADHFPELRNAKIKLLFDLKKRLSNGKIALARIQKANDFLRYLTINESRVEDGYDYFIFLDKTCFDNITREDKVRIIRHELQHIFIDIDSNTPFKIVPHEISDFYAEVELNSDDPRWRERVVDLTMSIYEQERDNN